jgi:intracellular multiplication protein IcmE
VAPSKGPSGGAAPQGPYNGKGLEKALLEASRGGIGDWVVLYTGSALRGGLGPVEGEGHGSGSLKGAPGAPAPGDILFAVTDTALNSDLPTPVSATVVEGPMKGAKAIGSFRLGGDDMVLEFSRMTAPDGRSMDMEAFAVDPSTAGAAVRSRKDTHFWSRWGSLLAASFIEGLGSAVSKRNTRVYTTRGFAVEEQLGRSMGDAALEALGKAGGKAAGLIERGFDRPTTVKVRAGESIAILITGIK